MTTQLLAPTLRLRAGLLACTFALAASCAGIRDLPYVATPVPLRILSVNDGGALEAIGLPDVRLPDSVTVIDLTSDQPPVTRTVSGTVPNTISGAPYAAIVEGGRCALIPSHSWGAQGTDADSPNQVAVVDLDAPGLDVAAVVPLPPNPWQALAHPDGERAIVITNHQFHVFRMEAGQPRLVAQSEPVPFSLVSFAIHPDASAIVATATSGELAASSRVELHLSQAHRIDRQPDRRAPHPRAPRPRLRAPSDRERSPSSTAIVRLLGRERCHRSRCGSYFPSDARAELCTERPKGPQQLKKSGSQDPRAPFEGLDSVPVSGWGGWQTAQVLARS